MAEVRSVQPRAVESDSTKEAEETTAPPSRRLTPRRLQRFTLLMLIPALAVAAGVYVYLGLGRYESTENAYVKSHIANVSPEVAGRIVDVRVEENQHVETGDLLFIIDDVPFQLALNEAEAKLAETETDIETDRRGYFAALSQIDLHEATVAYATSQLARQQRLIEKNLGREEDLDTATYELKNAQQQVEIARLNARALLAKLNGDPNIPFEQHPAWRTARLAVDKAELDLERTQVRAPFAGMIAKRPEPGTYVFPFAPVIAVISDQDVWVEANFKETQLAHMTPGQSVELSIDAYPGTRWHGRVESISRSTGAEFAMLPPQNATGNWVKIVQRVPVRIAVEDEHPGLALRAGMSCDVSVDTGYERHWRDLIPGG